MTIDERIERLTERHEALAESVQLLTADVHELSANVQHLVAESNRRNEETHALLNRMLDSMERLANIAAAHSTRLDDHEKRIDRIEGK
jgi:methyl-accepting chemotaxis protein